MKKHLFILIACFFSFSTLYAQTKKFYVWVETEASTVFLPGTQDWKPQVPYKHFVRLISEVMEVPDDYYVREQFYEYLVKNYLTDLNKMKLHKDYVRMGVGDYSDSNPLAERDYKLMFQPVERASWQFETILIKGFKYNPAKKTPGPLFDRARKIVMEGKD
ncbi:MAG TPA: hypothetical protein VK668_17080 [Mucilaginibacter sp.]|nr:hypothetical protein [Mucilaginibacter sp.]